MSRRADLELYRQANHYINEGLIRVNTVAGQQTRSRRQWMERFLPRLGDPQLATPCIHVAGTSGKGSVATMIAEILRAAGVRAGLHISPYLQASTEKLWCDGRYASAAELAQLVEWIRPHAEACKGPQVPLHGMVSVAIALEFFRRQAVVAGVMEVGVGGRHDLTNVLDTRVAVISSVGLDHIKTLGPTLEDIAWHKAGIIKPGCTAVALDGPGADAARRQAQQVGAPLRVLTRDSYRGAQDQTGRGVLSYRGPRYQLEGVPLAMVGPFQAENAALAVAAVELWDEEERITVAHVEQGLGQARLPARMELIAPGAKSPCPVLLDGAHNPDKLGAMLDSLQSLEPRRIHLIYGSLASRAPDDQIRRLGALSHTLWITEPQVYCKAARPAAEIGEALGAVASVPVMLEPRPLQALAGALDRAGPDDLILITGSLYLCGELRDHWYPTEEVIHRRASWF